MKESTIHKTTLTREFADNFEINDLLTKDFAKNTARIILSEVMKSRRVSNLGKLCECVDCELCAGVHLPKIISAVKNSQPVVFILPAFPAKSLNHEKVLSALPDYAEQLALKFLGDLGQRIKKFYSPGIKIILCSDGRVFSDVVGIKEHNVTAYQAEFAKMIAMMSLSNISLFNLDDVYRDYSFTQMRDELMKRYGQSLAVLKDKILKGATKEASPDEQEANRMYRGITRFLFEDANYGAQIKSRTAIQKEARIKAYEVIRRSNAWSALIAERFPSAVRLSIHPQSCGSKKLGILLIGNECWMTPWHGVVVKTNTEFVLMKRAKAEALGAELIFSSDGRPSHYRLLTNH